MRVKSDAIMERILFITSTRIGDAVINSGVLAHYVDTHPQARFTIACGHLAAPLFEAVPRLDDIIVMNKQPMGGHWLNLWRRTITRRWDRVIDMRCSGTAWALWARHRHILARATQPMNKVYEAASVIPLDPAPHPHLYLSEDAQARATALFPTGRDVLAVCPSASMPYKTWPGDRFGALLHELTGPDGIMAGAQIAIFGGPGDKAAARPLHEALPEKQIIDLTGELALPDVAACLARARLFIGNDSGLMHMAAAVNTATLGLFGPSDERKYGPFGEHTAIVRGPTPFSQIDAAYPDRKLHPDSLLQDLEIDAVLDAATRLYKRTEHTT